MRRAKYLRRYEALYEEVLFILFNICDHKKDYPHIRLEDLVPLILDVFMKNRMKDVTFTVEMAVQEVLQAENTEAPFYDDSDDRLRGQIEAQRDLDIIYLRSNRDLSIQEKYIFCSLLTEKKDSNILQALQIVESELDSYKKSLIGKLHHAATSSTKQKSVGKGLSPVGKLRRLRHLH